MRAWEIRADAALDRALLLVRGWAAALLQGLRGRYAWQAARPVPARSHAQLTRLRTRRAPAATRPARPVCGSTRPRPLATRPELAELPPGHICGGHQSAAGRRGRLAVHPARHLARRNIVDDAGGDVP